MRFTRYTYMRAITINMHAILLVAENMTGEARSVAIRRLAGNGKKIADRVKREKVRLPGKLEYRIYRAVFG